MLEFDSEALNFRATSESFARFERRANATWVQAEHFEGRTSANRGVCK